MQITTLTEKNIKIAVVHSTELLITDVPTALDFIATVYYEGGCERIIVDKSNICEEFFDLKTKIAGEILQKFITYRIKIAIVGDFSVYNSKSLRDFIYECNNGKCIFFSASEQEAIDKLSTN